MRNNVIYCRDSMNMSEVGDNSIDLVISGPPYWDYIDYKSCSLNANDGKSAEQSLASYTQYLDRLLRWHSECFRVLRPGRYCIVNVGTITRNGKCYPLPYHTVGVLEKAGFVFQHDIIWHKVAGGRKHARVVIREPYPGYYAPNNRTEFLLVFKKDPDVRFAENGEKCRSRENEIAIDELFVREIANNVWYLLPKQSKLHPCPFPPEIPYRIIQLYSLKGETVLDPFMGIGTTARAAKALGRHYIGYEAQQQFVDIANEEISKTFKLRVPTVCEYNSARKKKESEEKPPRRNPLERKSLRK